jgi:hypothetical protein
MSVKHGNKRNDNPGSEIGTPPRENSAAGKTPRKATKRPLSRRERAALRGKRNDARAVQLTPDTPPTDIDQLRLKVARRIIMFIANRAEYWRGCREPACRRTRACIAPDGECRNAPPLPPDPDGRRLARTLAEFRRALERRVAEEHESTPPHAEERPQAASRKVERPHAARRASAKRSSA